MALQLKDLFFSYSDRIILKNVSLTIYKGGIYRNHWAKRERKVNVAKKHIQGAQTSKGNDPSGWRRFISITSQKSCQKNGSRWTRKCSPVRLQGGRNCRHGKKPVQKTFQSGHPGG